MILTDRALFSGVEVRSCMQNLPSARKNRRNTRVVSAVVNHEICRTGLRRGRVARPIFARLNKIEDGICPQGLLGWYYWQGRLQATASVADGTSQANAM